jgi:dihydroorotase
MVLIDSGKSHWNRFSEVMSAKPAAISGIEGQGQPLEVGSIANIVLIDPTAQRTIQDGGASKSNNQPFKGMSLPGAVVHTVFRGEFTVMNNKLAK